MSSIHAKAKIFSQTPLLVLLMSTSTIFAIVTPTALEAEFELDFTPNGNGGGWGGGNNTGCDGNGGGFGGGWGGNNGPSGCSGFFIQESVSGYTHVIIGNPETDDFALEWYIGGSSGGGWGGGGSGDFTWGSASSPLSSNTNVSGIGSGNPSRVHMRQLLKGEGYSSEFLKKFNAQKPVITDNISSDTMQSEFSLDMSNSNYSDSNISGTMINRLKVEGISEFDADTDLQNSNSSIGRYTYSSGNYFYEDGGFDIDNINWVGFCDPTQNTEHDCNIGGNSSWGGGGGWGW